MRSQTTSLGQFLLFAVVFLGFAARPSLAQVTGVATIQGVVMDNSGAVVVGAELDVTNPGTGVALKDTTNEDGLYRLSGFNPGRYIIEVTASGFAPTRVTEVRLEVGQTARLDIPLKPGSVSETVEVTAQATLLNSETTDVGRATTCSSVLNRSTSSTQRPSAIRTWRSATSMSAGSLRRATHAASSSR